MLATPPDFSVHAMQRQVHGVLETLRSDLRALVNFVICQRPHIPTVTLTTVSAIRAGRGSRAGPSAREPGTTAARPGPGESVRM